MKIIYKNKSINKICTDVSYATRVYGREMMIKIHLRIEQIFASLYVEELVQNNVGRCHLLKGDRRGEYAMDLVHPYRLVFRVNKLGDLQVARIEEIVDYHH